jgi:thiamine-phosphate pyrophosphorylase
MTPRLFLVAPDALPEATLLACATSAAQTADCASILLPKSARRETVEALQALNLAVLIQDAEASHVTALKADGLLLSSLEHFAEARKSLTNESLGFLAGVSRHAAMEASELGADVMCFTQTKQYAGEPIVGWWQDVTEVPAFAFDPVTDAALKPQNPDFIRPSDEMWTDAATAAKVVTDLMAKWSA